MSLKTMRNLILKFVQVSHLGTKTHHSIYSASTSGNVTVKTYGILLGYDQVFLNLLEFTNEREGWSPPQLASWKVMELLNFDGSIQRYAECNPNRIRNIPITNVLGVDVVMEIGIDTSTIHSRNSLYQSPFEKRKIKIENLEYIKRNVNVGDKIGRIRSRIRTQEEVDEKHKEIDAAIEILNDEEHQAMIEAERREDAKYYNLRMKFSQRFIVGKCEVK